jgi:hypothetical protein
MAGLTGILNPEAGFNDSYQGIMRNSFIEKKQEKDHY